MTHCDTICAFRVIRTSRSECPKECSEALQMPKSTPRSSALRARCSKSLEKQSLGHFLAWAPGHSCRLIALRGFSLRGFWKIQGFPFSGGKVPQNSPLTQIIASLPAGSLYSEDALGLAKGEFQVAFPPEKGNPCTYQNPPSENTPSATNVLENPNLLK